SFYNAVYTASDGVAMNSTANPATCLPGTNATLFVEAVLRRINWFRALSGIPAAVTLDPTTNTLCQMAALMMSANTNLSTTPPLTWRCYSSDGTNAAANSLLALGAAGSDAITLYMRDHGSGNS